MDFSIRHIIREEIRRVFEYDDYEEDEYEDDEYEVEDAPFTRKLPEDIKRMSNEYVGRGVTWYGDPEQMIVVYKDNVHGMFGNIYDPEKLQYVTDMIQNSPYNVEFECSYGTAIKVDIQNVMEHQQDVHSGDFSLNNDGYDDPYTTGDETLDQYLGNDDFFDDNGYGFYENAGNYVKSLKTFIANGRVSVQQAIDGFNKLETEEGDRENFQYFLELETALRDAVANGEGDLGEISVQLRDGHHRVMGAIAAGEQYVCVNLVKEDIAEFANDITRVTKKAQ